MNVALLTAAWLAPLLLIALALTKKGAPAPALAALPAIGAAMLLPPGYYVESSWLLLGARFGLSGVDRMFLVSAGLLWFAAAVYLWTYSRQDRFAARLRVFFMLAMSGNFAVIVGQDLVSFYVGFTVMGLAAYGLIVHDGRQESRRAGRIYLIMTVAGEFALLVAFLLLFQRTGSLLAVGAPGGPNGWEQALFVLAFGIKAGMAGVHFWLPLAHPAAPIPASAVLSGAMVKTALIGWIRFLPLGELAMPTLGGVMIVLGLVAAVLAIPIGVVQRDPKVVLAYSSVGKMGTAIAAIGFAAAVPAVAPAVIPAVAFFAAHHGFAKGSLFLGVGVLKGFSAWWIVVLALPAAVLAGLPFTSGATAKTMLKNALTDAPTHWLTALSAASTLATIGTATLMIRFLYLVGRKADRGRPVFGAPVWPWLGLALVSLGMAGMVYAPPSLATGWPAVAGVLAGLAVLVWRPPFLTALTGKIAPGDIISVSARVATRLDRVLKSVKSESLAFPRAPRLSAPKIERLVGRLDGLEAALASRSVSALMWLAVIAVAVLSSL